MHGTYHGVRGNSSCNVALAESRHDVVFLAGLVSVIFVDWVGSRIESFV